MRKNKIMIRTFAYLLTNSIKYYPIKSSAHIIIQQNHIHTTRLSQLFRFKRTNFFNYQRKHACNIALLKHNHLIHKE